MLPFLKVYASIKNLKKFSAAQEMLRLYFENALARAWQYVHCFVCSWVWGTHQAWGISSLLG